MKAPTDLMDKPLREVVAFLTRSTSSELQTVRVLYRCVARIRAESSDADEGSSPRRSVAVPGGGKSAPGRLDTPADYLQAIRDGERSYCDLLNDLFGYQMISLLFKILTKPMTMMIGRHFANTFSSRIFLLYNNGPRGTRANERCLGSFVNNICVA